MILPKVAQYRRGPDLPCLIVGLHGLYGQADVVEEAAGHALAGEVTGGARFVGVNAMTGLNVDRLFHDIVHEIVECVLPKVPGKRTETTRSHYSLIGPKWIKRPHHFKAV